MKSGQRQEFQRYTVTRPNREFRVRQIGRNAVGLDGRMLAARAMSLHQGRGQRMAGLVRGGLAAAKAEADKRKEDMKVKTMKLPYFAAMFYLRLAQRNDVIVAYTKILNICSICWAS